MHLLQLEWKKLAPNKMFRVATLMYLILAPLMYLAVKSSMGDAGEAGEGNAAVGLMMSHHAFPRIWSTMAYWCSWLTFFLITYLSAWMVTSEHEYRTARQNLITGMERSAFLWGKFQMILVLITGATAYMALLAFLFGLLEGGSGSVVHHEMFAIRNFFVQTFFYGSLSFMFAILFRKGGLAMIFFFSYILIIERIVYYLFFLAFLEDTTIGNYMPASSAWFTLPFYFINSNASGFMEGIANDKIKFLSPDQVIWVTLGYSLICWGISYWQFNKKDL